jgi:hypothetical protein
MRELLDILKDIKSGALPVGEIPGFLAWSFRKTIWVWLAITVILLTWFVR